MSHTAPDIELHVIVEKIAQELAKVDCELRCSSAGKASLGRLLRSIYLLSCIRGVDVKQSRFQPV